MRRGHHRGGWRTEAPRNFWSKLDEVAHFRPPQPFVRAPGFPPPFRNRFIRPPLFQQNNIRQADGAILEYRNRNVYQNNKYGHVSKQYRPYGQNSLKQNADKFLDNISKVHNAKSHHNAQLMSESDLFMKQVNFSAPPPPLPKKGFYDRNIDFNQKSSKNIQQLLPECSTRPHSSDYFEKNSFPSKDSQETFSRSVGDTVDIIRKRLLIRNESVDQEPTVMQANDGNDLDKSKTENYQHDNAPQEQTSRRKYVKRQSSIKSNCNKLKDKIIHQLFKMDKGAIHKLLDNPNSSVKFEYAINSLLTESQNSFNKHTRAAAERSLNSVNTDQFQYHNEDTIYEDTFLKQMQCILDPTDTVLLADIKPMVMAEINKVLQIGEEERTDFVDENEIFNTSLLESETIETPQEITNIYDDIQNYEYDVSGESSNYHSKPINVPEENIRTEKNIYGSQMFINQEESDFLLKKKFIESLRKEDKTFQNQVSRRRSSDHNCDRRTSRNSTSSVPANNDNTENDSFSIEKTIPLFESHIEIISDEEDPFDELDKQYHVAVDPTFIDNDSAGDQGIPSTNILMDISPQKSLVTPHFEHNGYSDDSNTKRSNTTTVMQNLTSRGENARLDCNTEPASIKLEKETSCTINTLQLEKEDDNNIIRSIERDKFYCKAEKVNKFHVVKKEKTPEKNNYTSDSNPRLNSEKCVPERASEQKRARKRSIDQRESHRKEKRKKNDTNKNSEKILNKNIIINVTDCSAKPSEKCDTNAKSIFNLFFTKDSDEKDSQKQSKRNNMDETTYSEKYVRRKDTPKKKDNQNDGTMKRRRSSSTSIYHSTQNSEGNVYSPDDNTTIKNENKTKLTSIDMFTEQPRKANIHQALRNTAMLDSKLRLSEEKNGHPVVRSKPKAVKDVKDLIPISALRKSKETQTLHTMQVTTRFCQTETKKLISTGTQTTLMKDQPEFERTGDVYVRMKEIDLEIQLLLQERFKLYNSIDAKEASSVMTDLGMTVIDMTPFEDTSREIVTEDAIIDNIANLPEEELEQIVLHGVEDTIINDMPIDEGMPMRSRKKKKVHNRRKGIYKINEHIPFVKPKKMRKKSGNSNMSLLEPIVIDDRPLEDDIPLKDLETTPQKRRYRKKKFVKEKKVKQKMTMLNFKIRPCSVVVVREDISKYLTEEKDKVSINKYLIGDKEQIPVREKVTLSEPLLQQPVNEEHFQYDMLDVSEDIVIDSNCEVDKTMVDNDVILYDVSYAEEVVDNSQMAQTSPQGDAMQNSTICRVYDFSIDGESRQDVMRVSGNADAVLAIECIENNFLAACLDGNVYYYSSDGQLQKTLRGSNLAVTCLSIVEEKYGTTVYTGSLDSRIRYYDLQTGLEKGPECNVLSPIQTMDRAWDTIFVGTRTGFVLQFECKNNMLIPVSTIKFSENSILALRALKEGPRKVLLVAARSENVTIKDAQTGLLLRTLEGPKMTVYTLLYEEGKVFCGTSSHQIQVFDYASGIHVGEHEGGKGAVCLRACGGLLLAGCYDGCVYVYRSGERSPIAQLRGPAVMLLSLSVVGNKIIAGYNDRSLYIWKMPVSILEEMIL